MKLKAHDILPWILIVVLVWYIIYLANTYAPAPTGTKTVVSPAGRGLSANDISNMVEYKNTEYGFSFTLPASWKGYSIITEEWQGLSAGETAWETVATTGPLISIRYPEWTEDIPQQDIPVMVFTLDQWAKLQNDEFHIGAAPIGPRELGRNSKYVFALPARYNYAFPVGYEEVDQIINDKTSFHAF